MAGETKDNAPGRGGKAARMHGCRTVDQLLKIQSTDQNLHASQNPHQMHLGWRLLKIRRLIASVHNI